MRELSDAIKRILDYKKTDNPFFVYSSTLLKSKALEIKTFLKNTGLSDRGSRFYYSLKANPSEMLVEILMNQFDGLDVSSLRELQYALSLGVKSSCITASGPAKTNSFLREALKANVKTIHIDNFEELEVIQSILKTEKSSTQFTLRINVDSFSSKLGMNESILENILLKKDFKLIGFHCYAGREKFSNEVMVNILDRIYKLYIRHFDVNEPLTLFLGPGLSSQIDSYSSDKISHELLSNDNVTINFEIGRAVVESSATYCCKVLSVKTSPQEKKEIIINGGIQHLSSTLISLKKRTKVAIDYFGFEPSQVKSSANIFGSLCLSNDLVFMLDDCPENIKRGHWISLFPCGAYNVSASAKDFIMQDEAEKYMLIDNVLKPMKF